jgi:bacillithiol synthase
VQLSLPLAEYAGASRFLRTYCADYARVAKWFHYDPHDPACFEERLAELDARPSVDRKALAAAAAAQQQRWGAGSLAQAAALALGEPGTYSIVTGQQVGLFGGPLYTQLKAIAALLLARKLGAMFPGKRFVPTFWMGTSDSDFDEVRQAHLLDRDGQLCEIALAEASTADEGKVVAQHNVAALLPEALAQLEQALPGGMYRDDATVLLREAYLPQQAQDIAGAGLAGGFARYMARLFEQTELVLLDPQDPVLMRAAIPLLEHELDFAELIEQALLKRNTELTAAGFALQVEQLPGDTSLFLLDDQQRRRKLSREGDGFVLRQTGERMSLAELKQLVHAAPERFVPGVMLRPVYQNTLFPPAAFIGGGAELAYRAQTSTVFDHHGQRQAPAFFRSSATLLPVKSAALLDELGLELDSCYCLPQDFANRAVSSSRPEDLDAALAKYRAVLGSADRDLEMQALAFDPSLAETFATLRSNLERHVERLEKKVTSALKQRHEALLRRAALVQTQAYPQQSPQERVLGFAGFIPRYGAGLIYSLMEQLEAPSWEHRVVILE